MAKLTVGERLWLWRDRAGLSQAEAARHFDLALKAYKKLETDKAGTVSLAAPRVALRRGERLRLMRRRSGKRLKMLAKEFGVSHVTFLAMELRGDHRLFEYWQKAKF